MDEVRGILEASIDYGDSRFWAGRTAAVRVDLMVRSSSLRFPVIDRVCSRLAEGSQVYVHWCSGWTESLRIPDRDCRLWTRMTVCAALPELVPPGLLTGLATKLVCATLSQCCVLQWDTWGTNHANLRAVERTLDDWLGQSVLRDAVYPVDWSTVDTGSEGDLGALAAMIRKTCSPLCQKQDIGKSLSSFVGIVMC